MKKTIGLGAIGLGRAFSLTAPAFSRDPRVRIVAGADSRREVRERFQREFGVPAHEDYRALLGHPDVDAVYIATPHALHAEQAIAAARHGKHVLVEKPMALGAKDCRAMVDAARKAGVALIVGPSHSFDAPILKTRELLSSGKFGAIRAITAINFTDFASRRRREEIDTALNNQAPHQVDIVRLLAGSPVVSARAQATSGGYTAWLQFKSAASAALTYSGYGHYRTDELMGGTGELGKPGVAHPHFGVFIVSCENADLRPLPTGVMIHGDGEPRLERIAPPVVLRSEVVDELYGAIAEGKPATHSGEWGAETMEVCFAMARSAQEKREVAL